MKIISFDIGLKTCSIAVEEYKVNEGTIAPKQKYLKTGEGTEEFKAFVKNVATMGHVIKLEKRELGDKKAYFCGSAFMKLYQWCEELSEHLTSADVILIEQQMKCNHIAIALMYHLQAWLMIHGCNKVQLYPSKNKTRILGAPLKVAQEDGKMKKVTKYERKKWSTIWADEILKTRGDTEWHSYIFVANKSKKDDLSDVIMQTLSYVVGCLL